jgi:hypothetical protein
MESKSIPAGGVAKGAVMSQNYGGYLAAHQSVLILPWPDSTGHYLILHQPIKIVDWDGGDFDVVSLKLLGTLVNMGANNGEGTVVWKNQPLVEDTLYVGHLTANRHANGRDWWIPVGERNSNAYHTLVIYPRRLARYLHPGDWR